MKEETTLTECEDHVLDKIIYVFNEQEPDYHEEEMIFSSNEGEGDEFVFHEEEVLIDIFNNLSIWDLPLLEYNIDSFSCFNMPRTHEAFQQAMMELSHSKESREYMEDLNICDMGSNREDDGSVLQDLNSMGRDEIEDTMENNCDKLKQHIGLVFSNDIREILVETISSIVYFVITARVLFAAMVSYHSNYWNGIFLHCNDLVKIKISVIHFALTARSLFASMVAHHDHYIHDLNQERSWQKRNCLCGKDDSWKLNEIDFREILTQDDKEYSSLIMWKLNKFYIKEVLTLNDGVDFRISFINKLKVWNCDPHTRNDGECHVMVFIPLSTLFISICSLLCENQRLIISHKKLIKTSYLRKEKALLEGGSPPTTPGGKNIFEEFNENLE
jgi:hypothetical protein